VVALFCVDFAPQKSLVYAQSETSGCPTATSEDESGDVSNQKSKKIVACDNDSYVWNLTIKGALRRLDVIH